MYKSLIHCALKVAFHYDIFPKGEKHFEKEKLPFFKKAPPKRMITTQYEAIMNQRRVIINVDCFMDEGK